MRASFPYEVKTSAIFRFIRKPVVHVNFWSVRFNHFLRYTLIVDTGADYTLFPKSISDDLGIDLKKDCVQYKSKGVGGEAKVYLAKKKIDILVGQVKRQIPFGFLDHDDIPPLLGRQECLDTFKLTLENFITTFSDEK